MEERCTGIRYTKEAQDQELLLEDLQKNNQRFVEIDQCGDNAEVKKSGRGVQVSFFVGNVPKSGTQGNIELHQRLKE